MARHSQMESNGIVLTTLTNALLHSSDELAVRESLDTLARAELRDTTCEPAATQAAR